MTGILKVSLPATFGARQVARHLPAFLERHPLVKIDLMMSDRYENLIAEGADIAIRLGNQPASSFTARKLAETRRLFVAAPAYPARRGTPKRLSDLRAHHLIGSPSDGGEKTWKVRRNGTTEIQPADPRVRTRLAAGAVACASAGLGITIGSTWTCASELGAGELVEVLPQYKLEPATAFLIFPAGRQRSEKARAFGDYLLQALASGE